MATILLKRSATANAVPSAGSLSVGELAVNTADGRLFVKKSDNTVAEITGGSASYTLPVASVSVLGGVKLGSGVSVDANGFLSVSTAYAGLGSNSFTGAQNLQDNELIRAKIRDYSQTLSSPTISAGTLTLNLETSNIFAVSLNAAITTLTISNPPATDSGGAFTLILTADGTARAITWGDAIKWPGGTPPTLTSGNGKRDVFTFVTTNAGISYYGFNSGQNF
jgi:hypothetical protein